MNYRFMPNVDIAPSHATARGVCARDADGLGTHQMMVTFVTIMTLLFGLALASQTQSAWSLLLWAPIVEEAVFRLGLHAALKKRIGGSNKMLSASCVLTALCFGFAHALYRGPLLGFAVILPALCIGILFERTRQLMPCIALHMAFNAMWLFLAPHLFNSSPLQF